MNSHYEKFIATGEVKCIDDEIPFEIPESWVWCRISSAFQLNPKNKCDDSLDAAFIPMEKIEATYGSSFSYAKAKWKDIKNGFTHFADGDVAFAKITPCFQNRKSAIFNNLPNGIGAGTTELKVLRPLGDTICRWYLLFFLESPYFIEEAIFKGTANQQRILSGYLENKLFPVPPKEEQERIVEKLNVLLNLSNAYEKSYDALEALNANIHERLKKSILQEAIQGKLVPQDPNDEPASVLLERIREEKLRLVKESKLKKKDITDSIIFKGEDNKYYEQVGSNILDVNEEIPFDIPDSWAWCRLGCLTNMRIGKTPTRGDSSLWQSGIYPWISISDMTDKGIVLSTKEKITEKAAKEVMGAISPAGSLIMSFKLTVGKTAFLKMDAYHNEAIVTIQTYCDFNGFIKTYLSRILPLIANYGETKDAIKGKTLNSQSLNALLIPLPPITEQNRIIEKYDTILSMIEN